MKQFYTFIKKPFRILAMTVAGFICLILMYLVCAWAMARIHLTGEKSGDNDLSVYLMTNGVHTDIVVPAKNHIMDWTKEIKYSDTRSRDSTHQYLAMGWGDKGFYLETPTWADLKASVAFKAATGLSTTAIHATYHNRIRVGDSCRKINISESQYRKLVHYITSSFQQDANGHFINIKTNANYGETDAFYEAHGSYSMFHTCNTWVNTGLKHTGLKHCLWTPFDTGLFLLYK
jgi:uncharacterized protein (TIGR02117 family)